MIRIIVHNLDILRSILGAPELEVEFPEEPTVAEVLDALDRKGGERTHRLLFDTDGGLRRSLSFVLNDEKLILGDEMDRKLKDNTRITVLLPIAGGVTGELNAKFKMQIAN